MENKDKNNMPMWWIHFQHWNLYIFSKVLMQKFQIFHFIASLINHVLTIIINNPHYQYSIVSVYPANDIASGYERLTGVSIAHFIIHILPGPLLISYVCHICSLWIFFLLIQWYGVSKMASFRIKSHYWDKKNLLFKRFSVPKLEVIACGPVSTICHHHS